MVPHLDAERVVSLGLQLLVLHCVALKGNLKAQQRADHLVDLLAENLVIVKVESLAVVMVESWGLLL